MHSTKQRFTIAAIISIDFLILVFFIFSANAGARMYYTAKNGQRAIQEAQKTVKQFQISKTMIWLKLAQKSFESTSRDYKKFAWLKSLPYLERQYKAGDALFEAANLTVNSILTTVDVGDNVLRAINFRDIKNFKNFNAKQKRIILQTLYQSRPLIERAKSEIELAELDLKKSPKIGVLKPIKKYQDEFAAQLVEVKQPLELAALAMKFVPELAGYPKNQEYFIMFLNNRELRPTGGFFGTYGILELEAGEIKRLKTDDPYNLDNKTKIRITPPWQVPILINPQTKSWFLRDSNWSPDFPTSAEKALWFYKEEGGKDNPQAVISTTPTFYQYLMDVTGTIKVPGYETIFDRSNIVDIIQYHSEVKFRELGMREEFRKEIVGEIGQVLVKKLLSLPKDKWPQLAQVLQKSLQEKHLMLYSKNSELQALISQQNWGGEIRETSDVSDYLFVVDANVASLKTDEFIKRNYTYKIDLTKNPAEIELRLTYKNDAPGFTWKTTRYRNWNRIYIPQGSKLISIEGNEADRKYYGNLVNNYEILEEKNRLSIGTFISIEPWDEETLVYRYRLSDTLTKSLKNNYQLYIQKQGGSIDPHLIVEVTNNKTIKSYGPNFGQKNGNNAIFDWTMKGDAEIDINY